MSLQFITDSTGKTTGVYIPIKEWDKIKSKYKVIEQDEMEIPDWQIKEVKRRMKAHKKNPNEVLDFDQVMDEIEKEL